MCDWIVMYYFYYCYGFIFTRPQTPLGRTFPSQYTRGCPPCCPCRRGNAHLSPASQSWSVSLSYATSQTRITIQRQTHTNTDKHTSFFNLTAILLFNDSESSNTTSVAAQKDSLKNTRGAKNCSKKTKIQTSPQGEISIYPYVHTYRHTN